MKKMFYIILSVIVMTSMIGCGNTQQLQNIEITNNVNQETSLENNLQLDIVEEDIKDNSSNIDSYFQFNRDKIKEVLSIYTQKTNHTTMSCEKTLVSIHNKDLNSYATGVIFDYINNQTVLLTNKHVVLDENYEQTTNLEIIFSNKDFYDENIEIILCKNEDLALILLDYNLEKSNNYAISLDYNNYSEKIEIEEVFCYNCAKYDNIVEISGYDKINQTPLEIASTLVVFDITFDQSKIDYRFGTSGSGVYTKDGTFLGIVTSANDITFNAIALDTILTFISENL